MPLRRLNDLGIIDLNPSHFKRFLAESRTPYRPVRPAERTRNPLCRCSGPVVKFATL